MLEITSKLHQFRDGVAQSFSHTRGWKITPFYKNGVVLYNMATLFDNTNAVSKSEQSDHIVQGVFCQTFMKSCQITHNLLQMILPKYGQISAHVFSLNDLPNSGPNTNCVT